VVLEIHLDNFIGESEHNSMAGSHPLFNIDDILDLAFRELIRIYRSRLVSLGLLTALQVASEML
jgi:hypothetical protein